MQSVLQREDRRENRPRPSNRARGAAGAWVGALGAFVLVLMLVPPSLAATPASSTVLKAPFTNATVAVSNPMTHAGGGKGTLVVGASFNKTTGIGLFSDNASAKWKTTSTNNSALATGRIQITLPITIATTGTHSITIIWTTRSVGSVNLTAGTCRGNATIASTSCTRFAQAFVHGFAILMDKTNSTSIRVQNWPGNFTSVWNNTTCAFTHCTSSASATHSSALHTGRAGWSWDFTSVSLVSTHKYVLEMVLFGGSEVTLSVSGATLKNASGNAQFNSATLGNDQLLDSVTIS